MRRRFLPLAALVLLLVSAPGPATPQTQAFVTLAELRNLVRPLLIFAPTPGDPQLATQVRTLEDHLHQTRTLSILPVGVPLPNNPPTAAKFTDAEARSIRRRFEVAPTDFAVILLDQEGREIYRSPRPLSMPELARMIKGLAHPIVK